MENGMRAPALIYAMYCLAVVPPQFVKLVAHAWIKRKWRYLIRKDAGFWNIQNWVRKPLRERALMRLNGIWDFRHFNFWTDSAKMASNLFVAALER
jgi:hypothetical protein